jgi:multiple antibiotic resistance protein
MPVWFGSFLLAFIPLFVAIDPIGQAPVYLTLSSNVELLHRRAAVWHAVITAFCAGAGFMFLGKLVFKALNITVADFQIAGGVILGAIAMQELISSEAQARVVSKDFGVVPLGLPMIAGPGTLTLLLTLVDTQGVVITLSALVTNLFLVFLVLRGADLLARLVGVTVLRAFSRVNALLLAAFAVNLIRRGWQSQL